MKKLVYLLFVMIVGSVFFGACSNNETYADMLAKENRLIQGLIKDSGIVVLSQSEFYARDSVTNVSRNEFVQLASGVYMQIVDKGSSDPADTISNNDHVLVRFIEYHIKDTMNISCTNIDLPYLVDEFRYTATTTQVAGVFLSGVMRSTYQATDVPPGWLTVFPYIRDGAHVKLIVPSKMGHSTSSQLVYPYYYDLQKLTFYK